MAAPVICHYVLVLIAANSVLAQHTICSLHISNLIYTQQAKGLNKVLHLQARLSVQSLSSIDSTLHNSTSCEHLTQCYSLTNAYPYAALIAAIY